MRHMNMHRMQRILAVLAGAAAVLSLAACTPVGRAVGDTQDNPPAVAHDSVHTSDATVGFVGSLDAAADKMAIDVMADGGVNVFYASLDGTTGPAENAKTGGEGAQSDKASPAGGSGGESAPGASSSGFDAGAGSFRTLVSDTAATAAQQAVDDFVARTVKIIVISGINVTDGNRQGWDRALTNAREAGIPVALLNPTAVPGDDLLYAATLTVNDRATDATPLTDAVLAILRDEPHDRAIIVSTTGGASAESGGATL